jgi:hypothetical protein
MTEQQQKNYFEEIVSKINANLDDKDFRIMCDTIAIEQMGIDPDLYFNDSKFRSAFVTKCSVFAEQFKREHLI